MRLHSWGGQCVDHRPPTKPNPCVGRNSRARDFVQAHLCKPMCAKTLVQDERQATNCASHSRSTFGIHSEYIRSTNRSTFGVCKSQYFETFALLKRRSLHPSFEHECLKSIAICILRMYSDWYSECSPIVFRLYSE